MSATSAAASALPPVGSARATPATPSKTFANVLQQQTAPAAAQTHTENETGSTDAAKRFPKHRRDDIPAIARAGGQPSPAPLASPTLPVADRPRPTSQPPSLDNDLGGDAVPGATDTAATGQQDLPGASPTSAMATSSDSSDLIAGTSTTSAITSGTSTAGISAGGTSAAGASGESGARATAGPPSPAGDPHSPSTPSSVTAHLLALPAPAASLDAADRASAALHDASQQANAKSAQGQSSVPAQVTPVVSAGGRGASSGHLPSPANPSQTVGPHPAPVALPAQTPPQSATGNGAQPHHESRDDARAGKQTDPAQDPASTNLPAATQDLNPSLPPMVLPPAQLAMSTPPPAPPSSLAASTGNPPSAPAGITAQPTSAVDPAPAPALSAIAAARLIRTAAGSELRVGTRSEDFGAISIHTVLGRDQLSAHISLENEHLTSVLAGHLPSLQQSLADRLGQAPGTRAAVTLTAGIAADAGQTNHRHAGHDAANQGQGGSPAQHDRGRDSSVSAADRTGTARGTSRDLPLYATASAAALPGRLDIRI